MGVGGILIDTSVIFLNNKLDDNDEVVPGVVYLLDKLQHSDIPTVIHHFISYCLKNVFTNNLCLLKPIIATLCREYVIP